MRRIRGTAGVVGWPSDNYYEGDNEWDSGKSMELARLQKLDPSMDEQIASYANQLMADAHEHRAFYGGNTQDLYSMAQDRYLGKMRPYLGVRATTQKAKNPMLFGG